MAILAPVMVAHAGKLPFMRVLMARGTRGKGHAIERLLALGKMTLHASYLCMFSEKRVSSLDMVRDGEMGGLPTGFVVTRFAVAGICPMGELSGVPIGVAIETVRERDFRLKVLGLVTGLASHGCMLAEQRIVGLAMIEPVGRKNLLPTAGDVAACAVAAKTAAVRILVTRRAVGEQCEVLVLDGSSLDRRSRPVALRAIHPGMRADQWIARAVMREEGRILPGILRVAVSTPAAQLSGVHIAVARRAGCFETRERAVEVVTFEYGAILRIEVLRDVAPGALELRVLSFEFPSRLGVVEFVLGRRPPHQAVVQPVVLGMASRAVVIARTGFHLRGMVATLLRQTVSDLLVAVQTAKLRRSRAEYVAPGALQRSLKIVVRSAQRTGRHLCEDFRPQHRYAAQQQRAHTETR